jgi:Luciferase-like monooxygenase
MRQLDLNYCYSYCMMISSYYKFHLITFVASISTMRFCLEVWGTDYNKIKETCILAEKLGYYGFYYGEALAHIDLDCWTVISSLIALTNKIKLGPVITYLYPQYRSIALLAKQAERYLMEDWSSELEQAPPLNMQCNGGTLTE